jgi:kynurenine formamidase
MIIASLSINQQIFKANLQDPIDISIGMHSGAQNPSAFHIPFPRFEPIQVGDFIGSVAAGSGANCENLFINAHGNGTHTECIGHITKERISIHQSLKTFFFTAQLLSVQAKTLENGDNLINAEEVLPFVTPGIQALVLRSLPNQSSKLSQNYSGKNPTYLQPELCQALAALGVQHLLIDLPSVDREEDGGQMLAHKAFWQYPDNPRKEATITEMVFVPNEVPDDLYLLNIQIASLETDASPSKPLLFKLSQ